MTLTIYMTKGLPASGKTRWAKELLAQHPGAMVRVNRDDLRVMAHNDHHTPAIEKTTIALRDALIRQALALGKHVVVDDTNLDPKHEARIREIAADTKAQVVIQDFTDVPLAECIKRDQARGNCLGERGVGVQVIRQMWRRYLKPAEVAKPRYPVDPALPWVVIFDMDGTLADLNGRDPYNDLACDADLPNTPIVELAGVLQNTHTLIIMSGRHERARVKTLTWLGQQGLRPQMLLLRPDPTPGVPEAHDHEVKQALFDRHIRGIYNVWQVWDDRDQVVALWRDHYGLTCNQVAWGDF